MPFVTTIGPRPFRYSHVWGGNHRHNRSCYCGHCCQHRDIHQCGHGHDPVGGAIAVLAVMLLALIAIGLLVAI